MTVEQDTATPRSRPVEAPSPAAASPAADWTSSPLGSYALNRLDGDGKRFLARAPGRLDIMGGSAACSGSLALSMTLGEHACVAVQPRSDGLVSIAVVQSPELDGRKPFVFGANELNVARDGGFGVEDIHRLLGGPPSDTADRVVWALAAALAAGVIPDLGGGLSIVVGTAMDSLGDFGQEAARGAAILAAGATAMGVTFDPANVAGALQRAAPGWSTDPIAGVDVLAVLTGEPDAVMHVRCEPCQVTGSLRLPDNLVLIGIDSGVADSRTATKCRHMRTAAFMGRTLIDRIIRHEGSRHLQWDGHLARVSVTDYVERFRDRIPTKIRGRDFLDRFGEIPDPFAQIEPDVVYKVRSRTEHHIYEHDRANQFIERLSRAIRNRDERMLCDVGELMYASHWSYGQRCGLGGVETDLLVTLLRQQGAGAGIYGAKITGRGCGGVVAVLMAASDRATAAVDQVVQEYEQRTEHKTTSIRGSSPGTLVSGVRSI